jgi:hypothetical protein
MRAVSMMMAAILAAALPSLAGSDESFPSGTYSGTAVWRGPGGSTGSYTVEKTFADQTLRSRYTWKDTQARDEEHSVTFAAKPGSPDFDVVDEQGQIVGRGYCYDDTCAYSARFDSLSVDESFRWSNDGMTVLGSKSGPGFTVVWKETLEPR